MSSTCYISTNQHTKKAVKFTSLVLVLVLMPQYIYARSASILNASRLWYQQHAAFHT